MFLVDLQHYLECQPMSRAFFWVLLSVRTPSVGCTRIFCGGLGVSLHFDLTATNIVSNLSSLS